MASSDRIIIKSSHSNTGISLYVIYNIIGRKYILFRLGTYLSGGVVESRPPHWNFNDKKGFHTIEIESNKKIMYINIKQITI